MQLTLQIFEKSSCLWDDKTFFSNNPVDLREK